MSSRSRSLQRKARVVPLDDARELVSGDTCERGTRQFAALPWRRRSDGEVQVLLITSRESRRWVIPKGWPMHEMSPSAAAAREAYEEAGVFGEAASEALGAYVYDKRLPGGEVRAVEVQVFAMEVFVEKLAFPEQGQRDKRWFDLVAAAELVDEPGLQALIDAFDP